MEAKKLAVEGIAITKSLWQPCETRPANQNCNISKTLESCADKSLGTGVAIHRKIPQNLKFHNNPTPLSITNIVGHLLPHQTPIDITAVLPTTRYPLVNRSAANKVSCSKETTTTTVT